MSSILHALGEKHGTDKARIYHNGRSYLDIYQRYFQPNRLAIRSVLELGVRQGSSLKVWEEFFPKAHIFGLDIDPQAAKHTGGRRHVVVGSQDGVPAAKKLAQQARQAVPNWKGFDIIIDDASHVNELTLASFKLYWPLLAPRGIYVIEDLGNSYKDLTQHYPSWPGGKHLKRKVKLNNDRADMDEFFNGLVAEMDTLPKFGTRTTRNSHVSSIQFWSRMAFILK